MLMMIGKEIRGEICHSIHKYAKANNKYLRNYDNVIESSYLMYLDANNLYGQTMFQKSPVNGLNGKKMYLNLMKTYHEDSDKEYFLEVHVEYPKNVT